MNDWAEAMRLSPVGFGGAALGNLYAAVSDAEADETLQAAYAAGLRYFDTAPMYGYGLSETRLGRFLAETPPGSTRLSTKVGRRLRPLREGERFDEGFVDTPPMAPVFDYSRDGVRRAFEGSLGRLGVDSVDILFLHDIGAFTHGPGHAPLTRQGLEEALPELNAMKAEGLTRAVGVGVNEIDVCLDVLAHADVDCFLLAGRYTLLEQTPLDALFPACQARGMRIIVGGPYNSGLLAARGAPGRTFNYADAGPEVLARAEEIYAVCANHGVDVGAVALQFVLAHPLVASVIPGLRSPAEVRETAARATASLPAALWADLKDAGVIDVRAPTP